MVGELLRDVVGEFVGAVGSDGGPAMCAPNLQRLGYTVGQAPGEAPEPSANVADLVLTNRPSPSPFG